MTEGEIQEIVLRAAQGDYTAFKTLYERFDDYVKNTAFHIPNNREDPEDVAQNVWRKLLLNLLAATPRKPNTLDAEHRRYRAKR